MLIFCIKRYYNYFCCMIKESINRMPVSQVVIILGKRFKEYRLSYNLTQKEVSEQTGINIITIRKFENGQLYNITLQTFLRLLKILDRMEYIEELLPEIPMSAYMYDMVTSNKPRRARNVKK